MTARSALRSGGATLLALAMLAQAQVCAAAFSDFDDDNRSDILWRNSATGENYLYPMNGTQILGTEGYLRTVADQNWQVAGIGSTNAFQQILGTHPQWSGSIRAGSQKTLIVVSSDESAMSASTFTSQLQALDPDFAAMKFNAIVATVRPGTPILDPAISTGIGSAIDTTHIDLSALTGGIVGNLCTQDFAPYFAGFANAITQPAQ